MVVRLLAVFVLLLATITACGTSNDQGISFRALGFYHTDDGSEREEPYFASLTEESSVPFDRNNDGELDGVFLQLENNLVQTIQAVRAEMGYRVPGASINVPSSATPLFGVTLGPSSGQVPGRPPITFANFPIVSPATFEFLIQNRNRFPEPPFDMIAEIQVVGVTDAGDTIATNAVTFQITFRDERTFFCCQTCTIGRACGDSCQEASRDCTEGSGCACNA